MNCRTMGRPWRRSIVTCATWHCGLPEGFDMQELPATLARWYAAHSSIRRLWAVEDREALIVFVTLEPTSDGADAFPVWLANSNDWADDLRVRTHREVQLQLIVSDMFEATDVNSGRAVIAELSWRDSW